jgi:predicted MFS family arabinose efflux permease
VVLLLGLPAVALFVRDRPGMEPRTVSASSGATVPEALRSRGFWLLVLVLFFTSIGQNGALTHLSALLTDRGIATSGAAITLSAMGVASLAGRIFTGWLLDRFFGPRVSLGLLAVAALGMFLLADARSLTAGCAAAALIGVGMGGEADVTPYLLTRYFGLRSFSTLYGFTWTAYAIAGAIGPVLMGKAFDGAASYETFIQQVAALMLASAALMLFMPGYPAHSRSRNRIDVLTPEKGLPSSSA